MTHGPPPQAGAPAGPSTVVAFAPEASFGASFTELVPATLGLLALVLLLSFAVAAGGAERFLPPPCACARVARERLRPPLRALRRALVRLRERRFETLPRFAVNELAPLEREF